MVDMPEGLAALIRAQGKYDVEEIAARAAAVAESGLLDEPEVAEPRQTTIGEDLPFNDAGNDLPDSLLDPSLPSPNGHGLDARSSDPAQSHAAGREVEEREGDTFTFTPDTHKARILAVYASAERPLTDTEAWTRAGISARSGAWHRCSDLLDAKAIRYRGSVADPETGSDVRVCAITLEGAEILARLDKGQTVRL